METTVLGAAYFAGSTVDLWKARDEIAEQWQVERGFEPRMEEGRREELRGAVRSAVGRSLKWNEGIEQRMDSK